MTYVVLYCALLWLPFEKPDPWGIQNVLNMFDYWTPWQDGVVRGGLLKQDNLIGNLVYTSSLQWTVPTIQKWLSRALKRIARGPMTSTSKGRTVETSFYDWWGGFLGEYQGAEHHAKRFDNTRVKVFKDLFTSKKSAAVMEEVAHQSTISAPGSSSHLTSKKRLLAEDDCEPSPSGAGPSSSKRQRPWDEVDASGGGHLLQTSWRASEDESATDTIQAASSWESSRASSVLREVMEAEGDFEGGPEAYESDYASEADEGPTGKERGDEDSGLREVEGSAGKGKGRARAFKGWEPYELGGLVSPSMHQVFRKEFMDAETVRSNRIPVTKKFANDLWDEPLKGGGPWCLSSCEDCITITYGSDNCKLWPVM